MTVISGSDIFANNKTSLIISRSACCSQQLSALPSTADMRFRCNTDLLYASTLTSGNANVTAGPYITVTNSVAPLINAKGSVLIAKLRSGACPQYDVACLLPSEQEVLDKSMSQISYLGPGISGSLYVKPPHVLSHLLRVACQIHQSSQVPVRYRNQRQKFI